MSDILENTTRHLCVQAINTNNSENEEQKCTKALKIAYKYNTLVYIRCLYESYERVLLAFKTNNGCVIFGGEVEVNLNRLFS